MSNASCNLGLDRRGCALCAGAAFAAEPLSVKPLVEKKVSDLPAGELFWHAETFPTAAEAQAAAGPWSVVASTAGKHWLFTLGPAGAAAKGTRVAEVGPVPRIAGNEFLLRINEAKGAPGSITSVHTHPGSEAFLVLSGEQTIKTPGGVLKVNSGRAQAGHAADTPMQVSSSGETDLHALVMFLVDAARPFSTPAKMP